jgi:hypothetical protein
MNLTKEANMTILDQLPANSETGLPAARIRNSRFRSKKVTTRETREMHKFRARMAEVIRYLLKRLQGPMFAHIICTDIETGQHTYSLPTMAAYSAAIAPKYKMPVANVASLKRYNPRLVQMGLVAREDRYGVYDTAGNGIQASRISSLTTIAVEALTALMPEAIATESATYAVTDAAIEGAPVSIPTVFASIEANASERSPSAVSSSPPDDDTGPSLSPDAQAVQDVIEILAQWEINPETLATRMTAEAQDRNIGMVDLSRAIIWWGSSGPGCKGDTAGYLMNSLPTVWGQYEQHQSDQAVRQAKVKLAQEQLDQDVRDIEEQDRQKQDRLDPTCYRFEWTGEAWRVSQERYGRDLKSRPVARVFDTRPAPAQDVIWLSRSEWLRAGDRYHLSSRNDELTIEQVADIADAAVPAEDSTPAMV